MDYEKSFKDRVDKYLYAMDTYSIIALRDELATAVKHLDFNTMRSMKLLDIGGDGYIKPFLPASVMVSNIELNRSFSEKTGIPYYDLSSPLPFGDGTFDRIVILALLHHFTNDERLKLYSECYRVLKTDGKLIISDVIKGSAQDRWLNTVVDKWNSNGHKGMFFDEKDAELIANSGYCDIEIYRENYRWYFDDTLQMLDFVKNLFGLDLITGRDGDEVLLSEINKTLAPYGDGFDWSLIYFVATKTLNKDL